MTLEVREVGKSYGPARVLDSVSFEVEPGEVVAVCGENGAGKTTLMKVLTGLLAHGSYDGRVLLDGDELDMTGPRDAERRGIALLPQELMYYPELTVAENVLAGQVPSRLGLIDRRALDRRATELCREVGLDVHAGTTMRRLETAQRQLVSAARALAYDPTVLVLDEPTAALPRSAAEHLLAVVRRYAERGNTVLYVSHHIEEVRNLADRVAVLRNGRLVSPPRPNLTVREIVRAMVGDASARQADRRTSAHRPGPPALRARVEELRRRQEVLIEGVQVDVWPGEIVGVAGLTGSGREALLKALAGAPPGKARGWIEIAGSRHPLRSPRRLRRAGLSFLPDDRRAEALLPLASLTENVLLGLERFGGRAGLRRPSVEREAVRAALDRHQVDPPEPRTPIERLSGGNQQKTVLARAAFSRPRVMLLAEPTRGVDVGARVAIYDSVRDAARAETAVLISSGDVIELTELCDRILALWRGRVASELAGARISEERVLAAINGEPDNAGASAPRRKE